MAYYYAPQYQQWTSQETAVYSQHQCPQRQHTQYQYSQWQESYHQQAPSNVLRPNMAPSQPTIPVSSYSTLTGAVDYSNVTSNNSREKGIASIRKSRTNATPYIVPQHDTSHSQDLTRRNSQSQALASASRSARPCPIQDYKQGNKVTVDSPAVQPPSGPTNHVWVPQPDYFDERDKMWRYGPRFPPIVFQTAGFPEIGVRVGKIAHSQNPPPIEGPKDEIFAASGNREIQVWILWPGYSSEPLRKRIKTQGGKITRELFLTVLAHDVLDYTYSIYKKKIPIEPGYEKWTIGSKAEENTIVGGELFITRLVHRGGSNWQIELWAPKRF
ncbi:hypothetical protein E4T56_gene7105 [Termitomyces sp. T112]|nr:hypothetical protein E4T56_gene7105 [Termitomyces sp. T112]